MKVAAVGATGMVGQIILKVLAERNFPVTQLLPVASDKSVGSMITFKGFEYEVISLQDAVDSRPDLALASAGGETSMERAPRFAGDGTTVIDNASAWSMDPIKKLIIPEGNAS